MYFISQTTCFLPLYWVKYPNMILRAQTRNNINTNAAVSLKDLGYILDISKHLDRSAFKRGFRSLSVFPFDVVMSW